MSGVTTLRQAVSLLRTILESDMYFLLQELIKPGCLKYRANPSKDVKKFENGIKYCDLYLNNSICLDELCILINNCGLHEQLKQNVARFMSQDLIIKYIGCDEVD